MEASTQAVKLSQVGSCADFLSLLQPQFPHLLVSRESLLPATWKHPQPPLPTPHLGMEVCSSFPFRRLWTVTCSAIMNSRLQPGPDNTHPTLGIVFSHGACWEAVCRGRHEIAFLRQSQGAERLRICPLKQVPGDRGSLQLGCPLFLSRVSYRTWVQNLRDCLCPHS